MAGMETKKKKIEEFFFKKGRISNVECLKSKIFRTNRLANYIFTLREEGNIIHTEIIKSKEGKYIDCVYILEKKK